MRRTQTTDKSLQLLFLVHWGWHLVLKFSTAWEKKNPIEIPIFLPTQKKKREKKVLSVAVCIVKAQHIINRRLFFCLTFFLLFLLCRMLAYTCPKQFYLLWSTAWTWWFGFWGNCTVSVLPAPNKSLLVEL